MDKFRCHGALFGGVVVCETSRRRTRIATRRNRREGDKRYGVTSEHRTLPTENSWAQNSCKMTLKQSHTIRVWYVYHHLPNHGWYGNHEQTDRLSDDSVERRQRRQTTIQDSAVNVFMLTYDRVDQRFNTRFCTQDRRL